MAPGASGGGHCWETRGERFGESSAPSVLSGHFLNLPPYTSACCFWRSLEVTS
jgi:hypothetical protein